MPECPTCPKVLDTNQGVKLHHYYKHNESLAIETSECEKCSSTFDYYPSDKKGKFCSDCADDTPWDWKFEMTEEHLRKLHNARDSNIDRIKTSCDNCDRNISVTQSSFKRNDNNFCDIECMGEYRRKNWQGEDHPLWKGGEIESYGHGWSKIRQQARERDSYKCKICGKSKSEIGYGPEVHHIKPVRSFENIEDAHKLGNVISLCHKCHSNAEHGNIKTEELYQKI